MLIEFRDTDRMFGIKAIGIYLKGLEAAKAACEKVYATTMELDTAYTSASFVDGWLADNLDEMRIGEVRELDIATDSALSLRTACSVYLSQISKLREKQADLLVPIEDTNVIASHLTSLADRLSGQTEMRSVIKDDDKTTISVNGGPKIPMKEFERRVDALTTAATKAQRRGATVITREGAKRGLETIARAGRSTESGE